PRSREPGRLVFQERVHQFLDSVETQQGHELNDKIRERRTILLKSLDVCPYEDRKDINADRAPGTCEWFTQHEHFRAWESAHRPGLLWVSADPGCGKSVLSKFLVNVVLPKSGTTVCYFFFKDDFEDQKSAASAMCAIIRQLLQRHDGLMDDALLKMFETSERSLLLSFNRLFKILVHISSLCEENVVCVLDALDECQDYDRRPLMAELAKLYTNNPIGLNLKFLITSRGYRDIQRAFQKLENGVPTIHLKGEDDQQVQRISAEINTFISSRLDDLTESLGLQFSERQYLEKRLTKAKNRTYLWATLALDVVENILSITEASFQQALDNIPDGLDYLYDKILSRSENSEMARKIIHVILAAQTPLTVSEMSVAFAIGNGHREYSKIHLEPEDRFITTLRATCGLFISIVDKKVYFLHQTAREFLLSSRSETATKHALQSTAYNWKHTFTSTSSHAVLAWICVRLRIFDAKISDPSQRLPLGQYAFIYWAAHCEQAFPSTHDDLWQIAASLCQMICDGEIPTSLCGEVPQLEIPLLLAVFFGLEGAAQHILEKTPDALYHRDTRGTTPLYYAAGLGRTRMVRNLLEASSEEHYTNSVINNTNGGDTPLAAAMRRGHAETARALLADSRTRLHVPIITEIETNSFEDVIDLSDPPSILALLEDTRWRTELTTVELLALYKKTLVQGHLKHARDLVCNFGSRFNGLLDFTLDVLRTSHSLGGNLPDIIPVLRGINAQLDMDSRQTRKKKSHAVWYAASIGKFPEILEYLVDDAGFQPDTEGPDHNTPLFVCALHGYIEGIKVLLKTGKVRVNFQNRALSTPLMAACGPATSRLEGTDRCLPADLLLSHGADPNMRNRSGRTALFYAENNGNEMVRTLLCAKGLEDVAEDVAEDAGKDDGDIVTSHSALQLPTTVSANIKPVSNFTVMLASNCATANLGSIGSVGILCLM
ncbi:Vegetative incompatibility protein HET-E-1, partial [Colletotrichum viniferum]